MKSKALGILITVGLLGTSIAVVAQTAATSQHPVSLARGSAAAYSLTAEALSADRDTLLSALARAQAIVTKGRLSPKQTAMVETVLEDLAGAGTLHPIIAGGGVINNFPFVRMRACRLLGEIGGEKAMATLLQVLRNDRETLVLAEAVYQLGRIGKNPSDEVSSTIAWVVAREDARRPDDNLAYSALQAFADLARASHGLTDPAVFDAISQIEVGDYVLAVKEKAAQVLDQLRTYG